MKHLGGDALQQKALIDAGLLIENAENGKRYDRFRDRVMFPIRDSRGRVIAFGGRVLGDDKPKYLNSPETPVFHKGQELYGLYEARQANRDLDEIMVVEATWTSLPWPSKVCAMPSPPWAPPPARTPQTPVPHRSQRAVLLRRGRRRTQGCLARTGGYIAEPSGRAPRPLSVPAGRRRSDTLVRAEGTDAFRARIQQHSQPLADYFFQQLSEEADPRSLEGKAHLATLAAPLIERYRATTCAH